MVHTHRSNHQRCSINKGVLKNFAKSKGKHLWPQACNFVKKESLAHIFACEYIFLRTPFWKNSSGWMLLYPANVCWPPLSPGGVKPCFLTFLSLRRIFFNIVGLFLILQYSFGVNSCPEVFVKNVLLKNARNSQENTYARVFFK